VKKPQWITICIALFLFSLLFFFGKIVPTKKAISPEAVSLQSEKEFSFDSILTMAKKQLKPEQVIRLNTLENSISRGDVKDQQIKIYHQLANFWSDSVPFIEIYAWYLAQAARLENSGKSLTFAARLFLDNLQSDEIQERRRWKAMQAKDLFERSLKINPGNDSSKIGLGACYLFGNISATPMEGILKIREVVEKDTNNAYGQMMLAKGSLMSGQYDKAINRLQTVNRLQANNIEAILMLADAYEKINDKKNAINWYQKSLQYTKREDVKAEIRKKIEQLSK